MFSEEELIRTAVLIDDKEKRKSQNMKWIHAGLLHRKEEGKYFTLYKGRVEDSLRFHQYFRMPESPFSFYFVISDIRRPQEEKYRISPNIRRPPIFPMRKSEKFFFGKT
jgi:hypothetical protein